MLLRRVVEHVREQNWTAIGIDFLIVVIGVFVGIQVSNWNEDRETRKRGAEFTERLRADLHFERGFYAYLATQYRDALRRPSSYDELVSTGSLGLIKDAELLGIASRAYRCTPMNLVVASGLLRVDAAHEP